MKINHKLNHGWAPITTDPEWAERVEIEAARMTDAAAARYAKAHDRLVRAEERLAALKDSGLHNPSKIKRWEREVELRRDELNALARLIAQSPAGSQHRGKGSYRGIS